MTIKTEEAIEKLRLLQSGTPISNIKAFKPRDYMWNLYRTAISALEKQIPKKPKFQKNIYGADTDGNRGIELIDEICPNCESDIVLTTDYCPECGQRLRNEVAE